MHFWRFFYGDTKLAEERQWVFRELVKSEGDMEGLIAYAFYKHEKDQMATRLSAEGKDSEQINEQLRIFHYQTVRNASRLKDYKEKATRMIYSAIQDAEIKLIHEYSSEFEKVKAAYADKERKLKDKEQKFLEKSTKEQERIKSEIEAGINDGLVDFVRKAAEHHTSVPKLKCVRNWLISGFAGYAAGGVLVCIILALAAITSEKSVKDQLVEGFISNIIKYASNSPIPNVDSNFQAQPTKTAGDTLLQESSPPIPN